MSRVRVYMAMSLDGFIAGPHHELDWLELDRSAPGDLPPSPEALRFDAFMAEVGAMLMGRGTFDVVQRFATWPYGPTPVVVATRRPVDAPVATVHVASGDVAALVAQARALADGRDVYVDGGDVVRQALAADLVDELCITLVPVLLGAGIRLFDTLPRSIDLQFLSHHTYDGGMVQLTARVRRL